MGPRQGTEQRVPGTHETTMPRGFPVHREQEDRARGEEALRESIIRQIEAQQHQIAMQIALIKRSQVADEAGEALENLEAQLKSLDGQKAMAAVAPIPMLAGIAISLPSSFNQTHSVMSGASVEAVLQSGHLIGEMTHEVYESFSHRLDAAVSRHYTTEQHALRQATNSFKSAGYGKLGQHFSSVVQN